jgi:hypothetical protein
MQFISPPPEYDLIEALGSPPDLSLLCKAVNGMMLVWQTNATIVDNFTGFHVYPQSAEVYNIGHRWIYEYIDWDALDMILRTCVETNSIKPVTRLLDALRHIKPPQASYITGLRNDTITIKAIATDQCPILYPVDRELISKYMVQAGRTENLCTNDSWCEFELPDIERVINACAHVGTNARIHGALWPNIRAFVDALTVGARRGLFARLQKPLVIIIIQAYMKELTYPVW